MFSDGTEGYDRCLDCSKHFPMPRSKTKSLAQWVELLGPGIDYTTGNGDTGSIDLEKRLEQMDNNQFKNTPKIERDAIDCGFCSGKCRIKYLDKQNDRLTHDCYKATEENKGIKNRLKDYKKLENNLAKSQKDSKNWKEAWKGEEENSLTLTYELDRINTKPYRFALNHLWSTTRIFFRRFFHTDSFIEFMAKYIIVLLVGYILYETISRI